MISIRDFKYRVECLEGTSWVGKMICNFEDPSFYSIAKSTTAIYRILEDGQDVTYRYKSENKSVPQSVESSNSVKEVSKTSHSTTFLDNAKVSLKPSEYKNLTDSEKSYLYDLYVKIKSQGYKREQIMSRLKLTESAYDMFRKDIPTLEFHNCQYDEASDRSVIRTGLLRK